jgi:hypothetical protein
MTYTADIYFSQSGWSKSKIHVPALLGSSCTHSLIFRWLTLYCIPTGCRERPVGFSSLYESPNPIVEFPPFLSHLSLIAFQRYDLQMPSCCWLPFNTRVWGQWSTNIQFTVSPMVAKHPGVW